LLLPIVLFFLSLAGVFFLKKKKIIIPFYILNYL
jgi:hypothetical protein